MLVHTLAYFLFIRVLISKLRHSIAPTQWLWRWYSCSYNTLQLDPAPHSSLMLHINIILNIITALNASDVVFSLNGTLINILTI